MTYNGSAGSDKNAEFVQQLEAEFRDLAFDLLSKAEAFLEDVRKAGELRWDQERQHLSQGALPVGLAADCVGGLNGVVAHRAEDYLANEKVLNEKNLATSRHSSTPLAVRSVPRGLRELRGPPISAATA